MNYLDTIVHKKDDLASTKLKKTTIRDINEVDLKFYMNRIKKFNPGVTIYKSDYHKIRKTLVIVADRKVNIHRNINKVFFIIKNKEDIKREIKQLYNQNPINDEEYVNLEDVRNLFNKVFEHLYNRIECLKDKIDNIILNNYGNFASAVIYECKNNMIRLGFSLNYKERKYKSMTFKISDGEIKILKSESNRDSDILNLIDKDLIRLNGLYKQLSYFEAQYTSNSRSINSGFKVDIDFYGISIYIINSFNDCKLFEMKYSTYDDKAYVGNDDFSFISRNDLLKNIYIHISDCPEWCQEELYELRSRKMHKLYSKKGKRYSKK